MGTTVQENNAKKAIEWYYYGLLENNGYLYLDIAEVDYKKEIEKLERKNQDNTEYDERVEYLKAIEEYFKAKRWFPSNAYRKRQRFIFDTLRANNRKYSVLSNLIYNTDIIHVEKVTSVSSYLTILRKYSAENELFFRGQSSYKWGLKPSIYREPRLVENEKLMIDMMIQSNPDDFEFNTTFDVLSKLQHYDLPTRLIDITSNPLVALYFAARNDSSEDGQVFVFNPERERVKFVDSDTVAVLANIAKMEIDFGNTDIIERNTGRFIHFIRKEKPFFEDYLESGCLNDYVFVKANYNNKRIARQNGAFILVGIQTDKRVPCEVVESMERDNKYIKILIPHNSKKDIIEELNTLAINDGTMFPEIDSMAKYIKGKIGK